MIWISYNTLLSWCQATFQYQRIIRHIIYCCFLSHSLCHSPRGSINGMSRIKFPVSCIRDMKWSFQTMRVNPFNDKKSKVVIVTEMRALTFHVVKSFPSLFYSFISFFLNFVLIRCFFLLFALFVSRSNPGTILTFSSRIHVYTRCRHWHDSRHTPTQNSFAVCLEVFPKTFSKRGERASTRRITFTR